MDRLERKIVRVLIQTPVVLDLINFLRGPLEREVHGSHAPYHTLTRTCMLGICEHDMLGKLRQSRLFNFA